MENSVLQSTKKILGLAPEYTAFDADVCMFINSAFGTLRQLGVVSETPNVDHEVAEPPDDVTWDDVAALLTDTTTNETLNLVKTYIYLKVRMLFDPPTTSFLIEAMNTQIAEHEWRLNHGREMIAWTAPILPEEEVV